MRERVFREPARDPDRRNVEWLLSQFLGLANALRQIHNLESPDNSVETAPQLLSPIEQARRSAWHHDLKPENILYFKIPGSKYGRLLIADFGTGKVHTFRSGSINTRSANGTPTYEAPEAVSEGVTSRPYDIWSMGCVFLELLVWALLGYGSVENFASNRHGRRFPNSNRDVVRDDSFWQSVNGNLQLRESVSNWIQKLGEEIQDPNIRRFRGPFQSVLGLVNRMLDTDRLRRIDAVHLWNTLESIYKQTKMDLDRSHKEAFLPRLSTEAPEGQTIERMSPPLGQRSEHWVTRINSSGMSANFLTAQRPQGAPSSRGHRRNSSVSEYTSQSDAKFSDQSTSNASSTQAQTGSSSGLRTPDATNTTMRHGLGISNTPTNG